MLGRLLLGTTLAIAAALPAVAQDKEESFIKVEVKGKLQTGVMAIGSETTGVIIQTKDGTLELELGKNKELREGADKLNGKPVLVTGTLAIRKGVEVRQRFIVTVATLEAADAKDKEK